MQGSVLLIITERPKAVIALELHKRGCHG